MGVTETAKQARSLSPDSELANAPIGVFSGHVCGVLKLSGTESRAREFVSV